MKSMWTTCPDGPTSRRQRGFSIVAGIFILVVLAALAGFVVSVSTTQNVTFVQDLQGARAYQAARAGVERSIHQWLPATGTGTCTGTGGTPLTFAGTDLSGFSVTVTANVRTHAGSGIRFCDIVSTATTTGINPGSLGYVERELRAVVEAGD